MVERTDVAYVGRISSGFTPMVLLDDGDNAYYIPISVSGGDSTLAFSAGALSDSLLSNSTYPLVTMTATAVSGGWQFTIFNAAGGRLGYLAAPATGTDLAVGPTPSTFTVTTTDPNGYASGNLLTSVRYRLALSSNSTIRVNSSTVIASTTPGIGGLREDTSGSESVSLNDVTWTLMPSAMSAWLTASPSNVGTLPATVRLTQCVNTPGTTYNSSSYCTNWTNNRGFTNSADVRDIIYFYSQDGTCGQSYTFNNNYLDQDVNVSSSIGDCSGDSCIYSDSEFSCDDGFLNWRTIIMILIVLIIIIILFAVIVGAVIYLNKPKTPIPEEIPANTGIPVYT